MPPCEIHLPGGFAESIMEKHDDEAKAGNGRPELGPEADDLSVSLTGSSVEIDEKRHQHEHADEPGASDDKKIRPASDGLGDEAASAYSTDSSHSTERGEADLENEEIEETVPGRDLDRQLSRVGHPVTYFYSSNKPRWLPHVWRTLALTSTPRRFSGPRYREPAEDRVTRQHQVQSLARLFRRLGARPRQGRRRHQA